MGDSNNSLIWMFVIIFTALGIIMPFITAEFGDDSSEIDVEKVSDSLLYEDVSISDSIKSIVLMFFWTFGTIPVWLDLIILEPMRIVFYFIIWDKIRGI